MSSRTNSFLLGAAVMIVAALFFLGDGRYDLRSWNRLWDLGHLPAFALFAYVLATRCKPLAERRFSTQLLVILAVLALVGWSIEAIQLSVGRTFSWLDLRKNVLGAFIGLLFLAPGRSALPRKRRLGLQVLSIAWVLWEAMPLGRALLDEHIARKQFPLLSGLETRFERERWSGDAKYFVDFNVHRQGEACLGVVLGTETYSGVGLNYFPRDWRGYAFLCFDLFNPESEPIALTCRVHDAAHAPRGNRFEDRFNRSYRFDPGWQTVRIPLEEIRNAPKDRRMQMEQIDNFMIFAIRLPRPRTIYIDNVRLAP